ncbi:MAG TPA: O-antigen ligase family protein [Methylovirgula sp.]|nr:O-antigen ligase family protein [Methylovirgula sp.]
MTFRSVETYGAAQARRQSDVGLFDSPIETGLTFFILLFPVIGTFFPFEDYRTQQLNGQLQTFSESTLSSGTIGFAVMLVLFSYWSLRRGHASLVGFLRIWPLWGFTLYALLASSWAEAPGISLNRGGRMAIMILAASYLVQRHPLKKLIAMLTIALFVSACLSIAVAVFVPSLGVTFGYSAYSGAWRGAFDQKNNLGAMASIAIIVSAYSFRIKANPVIALPTILACALLSVTARSATSAIATVVSGLVASYLIQFVRVRRPQDKITLAAIGLILVMGSMSLVYFAGDLLNSIGRDSTFTGRDTIWALVRVAIDQRPIWGYGLGFWQSSSGILAEIWNALRWDAPEAHNTWLDAWLQLGLVGLLWLISLWLLAAKDIIVLLLSTRVEAVVFWAAILVDILVRSFTETLTIDPGIQWMFWFALAFASIQKLRAEYHAAPSDRYSFSAPTR